MATTAPSTIYTYPLNGSLKDFPINFEYLARKFVIVTLIGTDRKTLVLNADYRFSTRSQITTTKGWGPTDGYTMIEIKRVTSATERLVDFSDGSILKAYDLNTAQIQSLHIAEEARNLASDTLTVDADGNLDARGRRLVNLADAVSPNDAVSLYQNQQWAQSALSQANRSKAEADKSAVSAGQAAVSAATSAREAAAALVSQNASKASETASAASAGQSAASASQSAASAAKALVSEGAAKVSQTASKASEVEAKRQADIAIVEAGKLGNANALVAAVQTVTGNDVNWKGKHLMHGLTLEGASNPSVIWRSGAQTMEAYISAGGAWNLFAGSTAKNVFTVDQQGNSTVPGTSVATGFKTSKALLQADGNIIADLYRGASLKAELDQINPTVRWKEAGGQFLHEQQLQWQGSWGVQAGINEISFTQNMSRYSQITFVTAANTHQHTSPLSFPGVAVPFYLMIASSWYLVWWTRADFTRLFMSQAGHGASAISKIWTMRPTTPIIT